jgi:transcription initiation factor TFIIIB Brf1 subunit/transcription initiation factor TFIIB
VGAIEPPTPLPEPADPTVACARCDSTDVYCTPEDTAVCAHCGAVLEIELTEIHPG